MEPCRNGLPGSAVEQPDEPGGEHALADIGVGAGDDEALRHASASASAASSRSIAASSTLSVMLILSRAVPAGTVGGRMPRTSSPFARSEEHTSELQSLMRISYAVFRLKKKKMSIMYMLDPASHLTCLH